MLNIIEDLYKGNLEHDCATLPQDTTPNTFLKQLIEHENCLRAYLSENHDGVARLTAFSELQDSLAGVLTKRDFIAGFRLGALLLLDVLRPLL